MVSAATTSGHASAIVGVWGVTIFVARHGMPDTYTIDSRPIRKRSGANPCEV
jgi:hypothetical protein